MEFLSGQVVVEIHLHAVGRHFDHLAGNHSARLVHHGNHLAGDEQLLLYLAVDFEYVLGQVDHRLIVVYPVAFLGREDEFERVSHLLAEEILLELGQQISESVDELEGILFRGTVFHFAVYEQGVAQGDDLFILDCHGWGGDRVAGPLDHVDILEDYVVGEGDEDAADLDPPVKVLREGLCDLVDDACLDRGNLDGDEGGGRDDDHRKHHYPNYLLPGLHA